MDKFEEIRKYKELLEEGIISQEEFDEKKKSLLSSQESPNSKKLNSIINGAKEKTEQAKVVANEKLEEIKKKQAEDAEKKKIEEEERKKKEAELEQQKAEQAKLAEEQRKKEAEEKRIREEEKRKQYAEKKALQQQKRKAFFAKKSVKAVIGIICALILAFIGFCIYAYVTRDTIKDDVKDLSEFKCHELTCYAPSNWIEDKDKEKKSASTYPDSKSFNRMDENNNVMAVLTQYYLGDDLNIEEAAKKDITDEWESYSIDLSADEYVAYKHSGANENNADVATYLVVARKDYSVFETIIAVRTDGLNESAVETLIKAPLYSSYKNPAEVEDLSIEYNGSNEDGYTASAKDFQITVNYKDKTSSKAEVFEIVPTAPVVSSGKVTKVKVKCHGVEKDYELKGKQPEKIVASYSGETEAGTVISKGNKDLTVKVVWDDDSEDTVSDYTMDKNITLEAGETGEATITAYGKSTTLKVECSTLSEAQFKEKCETRDYKSLLREASYAEYTKIYGKVVQDCGKGYYRITSGGSRWDDVYMVTVLSGDTLVEDDWVTCYGVTAGIYTYETVMGATQKVPWLTAKYVDFD